jgi:hypothetical protein
VVAKALREARVARRWRAAVGVHHIHAHRAIGRVRRERQDIRKACCIGVVDDDDGVQGGTHIAWTRELRKRPQRCEVAAVRGDHDVEAVDLGNIGRMVCKPALQCGDCISEDGVAPDKAAALGVARLLRTADCVCKLRGR